MLPDNYGVAQSHRFARTWLRLVCKTEVHIRYRNIGGIERRCSARRGGRDRRKTVPRPILARNGSVVGWRE